MLGDQYYRFTNGRVESDGQGGFRERPGSVDPNYPRPLTVWSGLPDSVDAIFVWENGRTYFFKDDVYYRLNDNRLEVRDWMCLLDGPLCLRNWDFLFNDGFCQWNEFNLRSNGIRISVNGLSLEIELALLLLVWGFLLME